jgi:hypothetical protein
VVGGVGLDGAEGVEDLVELGVVPAGCVDAGVHGSGVVPVAGGRQPPTDGAGECVSVLLRRGYDAPIGDVWDAVTQPDRIKRWLMPISGELWAEVVRDSGSATAEQLAAATEVSLAQFAPDSATPPQQQNGD